ncbi:MAG: hypothetical protein HFF16_04815 [Angelakisella sp.]|nr:hypothetical protein [Angelakisella sp.]
MKDKLREAFARVQAEEELKNSTREFLDKKTKGYTKPAAPQCYKYAAVCACLLLVLLVGRWSYFTPMAEISIDINPSVELGVNRFDRVIWVKGFNEDGQALSKTLDVRFRSYTAAIREILANDEIAAMLSDDEIMTIAVTGRDKAHSSRMLLEVEACTAEQKNTYCYFAPPEEAAAAHGMGLSCGRYRAFLAVQALDPSITPDMVGGMTMREIRELMERLSGGEGNDSFWYGGQGSGHHGGNSGHGKGKGNGKGQRGD